MIEHAMVWIFLQQEKRMGSPESEGSLGCWYYPLAIDRSRGRLRSTSHLIAANCFCCA